MAGLVVLSVAAASNGSVCTMPPRSDGRCGSTFHNASCLVGQCCSSVQHCHSQRWQPESDSACGQNGFCGSSSRYCNSNQLCPRVLPSALFRRSEPLARMILTGLDRLSQFVAALSRHAEEAPSSGRVDVNASHVARTTMMPRNRNATGPSSPDNVSIDLAENTNETAPSASTGRGGQRDHDRPLTERPRTTTSPPRPEPSQDDSLPAVKCPGPARQDGRCGPGFGYASCAAGLCCSVVSVPDAGVSSRPLTSDVYVERMVWRHAQPLQRAVALRSSRSGRNRIGNVPGGPPSRWPMWTIVRRCTMQSPIVLLTGTRPVLSDRSATVGNGHTCTTNSMGGVVSHPTIATTSRCAPMRKPRRRYVLLRIPTRMRCLMMWDLVQGSRTHPSAPVRAFNWCGRRKQIVLTVR